MALQPLKTKEDISKEIKQLKSVSIGRATKKKKKQTKVYL